MPAGWEGGIGPGIKALAITFAYGCNLAQPKLAEWFGNMECAFRRGRFPICWTNKESFHEEKAAIYDAGLRSSSQRSE